MTAPTHYDVAYQINPWMRPADWTAAPQANRLAARRAWAELKRALERAGVRVEVMEGAPGAPDLVFPANAAVVLDGHALVARFRHPERACEEPHFLAALHRLKDRGLLRSVQQIEEGCFQEGAGDCLWDATRQLFWVASGPRSTPASAPAIGAVFGRPTVHLPLATERYYHLDTCFCPLPGGEILYYPPALTAEALDALHAHTSADQRIEASDEDAAAFSVNAVCVEREIIMARPPQRLADRLCERGYRVVAVDLDPFMLSGGGAFCMTLRLDWRSAAAGPLSRVAA
ncbi:MAG TPA: arginine deiminase-related protein [Caulobacteraceae bacterium]|nr:arginine deiminase-related protein [Caulobacteraceae bacterium]